MFARNLLQAGDYAMFVPTGLNITIQYSDKGTLQKVYLHHDVANRVELDNAVLKNLIQHSQVPSKISIQGGTTWIQGVLYTDTIVSGSGDLPQCLYDTLLELYISEPNLFTFYAGNVESLAQKFSGSIQVTQWLAISKFEVLPGYVISAGIDSDEKFSAMLMRDYKFTYEPTEYIVFRRDTVLYLSAGLSQKIVSAVTRNVDSFGNITAILTMQDGTSHQVSYATIVKHNIAAGTIVILRDDSIVSSTVMDGDTRDAVANTITCSCCGRKLLVPPNIHATFKCTDPQCNSVLYPRVQQLLRGFKLPVLTYAEYVELSTRVGNIFSLPDIFDEPAYKDAQTTLSLKEAVRAILPKSILPGDVQIAQLCDACNNSKDTLIYYVQNVDKLRSDLNLDSHTFHRLFNWLLNPENASDVVELLRLPNITFISSGYSFDGPPIFRNKTIMLTGTFRHGSFADIKAILESYSAVVVYTYSPAIDCILVGDISEGMNGSAVRSAHENNIPVFTEFNFFNEYDIDADLAKNLK